jgi:hypothetical protein
MFSIPGFAGIYHRAAGRTIHQMKLPPTVAAASKTKQ